VDIGLTTELSVLTADIGGKEKIMTELIRITVEVAIVVCIVLIALLVVWGVGWLNRRRGRSCRI